MLKKNAPRGPVDWSAMRKRMAAAGESRALSREAKDAILAERARLLARPVETAVTGAAHLRLATFALASEHYGIDARLVIEISRLSDFTPLPRAPSHLVGITNLRGEILPIFDVRALLGRSRRALDDLSRLIVLGKTRAEFGILADTTRELVSLSEMDLMPPPPSVSAEARHYLRGVTKDALVVLDGSVLLEDRRLFLDQNDDSDSQPTRSP
jgi:purine-binding chemotaxis protein CheW